MREREPLLDRWPDWALDNGAAFKDCYDMLSLTGRARDAVRRHRAAGMRWVRGFDMVRELGSAAGLARLWVKTVHRNALHQITEYTEAERYPELFDLAAKLRPSARRILSFGCSSGEEIEAIRQRFPGATIVGAEINPRSRAKARRRLSGDADVRILSSIQGEPQSRRGIASASTYSTSSWSSRARVPPSNSRLRNRARCPAESVCVSPTVFRL